MHRAEPLARCEDGLRGAARRPQAGAHLYSSSDVHRARNTERLEPVMDSRALGASIESSPVQRIQHVQHVQRVSLVTFCTLNCSDDSRRQPSSTCVLVLKNQEAGGTYERFTIAPSRRR